MNRRMMDNDGNEKNLNLIGINDKTKMFKFSLNYFRLPINEYVCVCVWCSCVCMHVDELDFFCLIFIDFFSFAFFFNTIDYG